MAFALSAIVFVEKAYVVMRCPRARVPGLQRVVNLYFDKAAFGVAER
jgi:hypothetical protein